MGGRMIWRVSEVAISEKDPIRRAFPILWRPRDPGTQLWCATVLLAGHDLYARQRYRG